MAMDNMPRKAPLSHREEWADLNAWLIIKATTRESGAHLLVYALVQERTGQITEYKRRFALTGSGMVNIFRDRLAGGTVLTLNVSFLLTTHPENSGIVEAYLTTDDDAASLVLFRLGRWAIGGSINGFYPGGPLYIAGESRGHLRSLTGTNPAAAAEIAETVPVRTLWRLLSLYSVLVTDANAANRRVTVSVDDGSAVVYHTTALQTQPASVTYTYSFSPVGGLFGSQTPNLVVNSPEEARYPAGYVFRSVIENIQAGDDWGAPQLLVEEWLLF